MRQRRLARAAAPNAGGGTARCTFLFFPTTPTHLRAGGILGSNGGHWAAPQVVGTGALADVLQVVAEPSQARRILSCVRLEALQLHCSDLSQ
jgi:hypothetical protein